MIVRQSNKARDSRWIDFLSFPATLLGFVNTSYRRKVGRDSVKVGILRELVVLSNLSRFQQKDRVAKPVRL